METEHFLIEPADKKRKIKLSDEFLQCVEDGLILSLMSSGMLSQTQDYYNFQEQPR